MPLDPSKIEVLMAAKSVSRAELAERTGIAQPNITRILSGKRNNPALSTAERLANALEVPLAKLLSE